jgi:nitrogen fixation NifU-like protein
MYSERLLSHFRDPRNVGVVEAPDAAVEVTNPACGDILQLSVRVEAGVIREARFLSRGCTAAIACGSAVTEWLTGRSCEELPGLAAAQIAGLVGNLAPESQHAAVLCLDGVKAIERQLRLRL